MPLPLPHVLAGRYALRRRLGSGTSAVTYRAIDRHTGRAVAVKVLHEHLAADRELATRFQREAETAATFHHRSVVEVLGHGRDGDLLFTVMELVDGGNLKDLVRAHAPLSVPRALALIQGVLQALEIIHQRQVVHRDVKPENILLARDGTPKLSDFGIARATDTRDLTRSGLTLGTAAYMAPEQALGEPVGPAADLYAAGIVLFQLLTGQLPFPGDDPLQVMFRQVHDAPPWPRDVNPAIPETLSATILHALDKDPANRFASAREMWRALAQAWSDASGAAAIGATDTLVVRPFSIVEGARPRDWRRLPAERLAAGMATVAAVLLIVTLGVTGLTRGSTTAADANPATTLTAPAATPAYLTDNQPPPAATTPAPSAVATDTAEQVAPREAAFEPTITPEPTAASAPSSELVSQPIDPNAVPPVIHEEPAALPPTPVPAEPSQKRSKPTHQGADQHEQQTGPAAPKPKDQPQPTHAAPRQSAPAKAATGKAKAQAQPNPGKGHK